MTDRKDGNTIKQKQKKIIKILGTITVLLTVVAASLYTYNLKKEAAEYQTTSPSRLLDDSSVVSQSTSTKEEIDQRDMQDVKQEKKAQTKKDVHPWNEPSEASYPIIKDPSKLSVEVSIPNQRVYIKENGETVYTMICSTGDSKAGTPTPTGDFVIEPERGDKFYWQEDDDWAYNWVSFSGHGVYLFHSVLMWNEHEVEEKEAVKLGQEASHGCIRLPLPDSKWFYDTITTGTPVTIS